MADTLRIEELRRRVQRDPASIAFAALAEEFRREGQYDAAIATCEAGLQRHPAYVSARVTLGRALLESGRFDRAQAELEEVLRAAPENLAAIRGLAEIHRRRSETADGAADETAPEDTAPEDGAPPFPMPLAPSAVAEPTTSQTPRTEPLPSSSALDLAHPAEAGAPVALAPACRPHPDEAALPALQAFLSAIQSAQPGRSAVKPSSR